MNRQQVHKYFRESGRLMISKHADALWATDSFLMVRIEDGSPITALLDYWNLPLEPGVFYVENNVRKGSGEPPAVGKLLALPKETKPLKGSLTLGRQTFLHLDGGYAGVWECGENSLLVASDQKMKTTERLTTTTGSWVGTKPEKPIFYTKDREVLAVLMTMRPR